MTRRLGPATGEAFDRTRSVNFQLDGRPRHAYEGDNIASAMAAAGVVVTARSFKYHRPRGLFCMTGACASCMVRVDGVPNLQACQTLVKEGRLGAPSLEFRRSSSASALWAS